MAVFIGSDSTVEVSSNGSSYSTVSEVLSFEINRQVNMVDVTTNTSAGVKEFLPGDSVATLSCTYLADRADTGQDLIRTSLGSKALIYFRYRQEGSGAGKDEVICSGYITEVSYGSTHEERVEQTVSLQINGAVTEQTQA